MNTSKNRNTESPEEVFTLVQRIMPNAFDMISNLAALNSCEAVRYISKRIGTPYQQADSSIFDGMFTSTKHEAATVLKALYASRDAGDLDDRHADAFALTFLAFLKTIEISNMSARIAALDEVGSQSAAGKLPMHEKHSNGETGEGKRENRQSLENLIKNHSLSCSDGQIQSSPNSSHSTNTDENITPDQKLGVQAIIYGANLRPRD